MDVKKVKIVKSSAPSIVAGSSKSSSAAIEAAVVSGCNNLRFEDNLVLSPPLIRILALSITRYQDLSPRRADECRSVSGFFFFFLEMTQGGVAETGEEVSWQPWAGVAEDDWRTESGQAPWRGPDSGEQTKECLGVATQNPEAFFMLKKSWREGNMKNM